MPKQSLGGVLKNVVLRNFTKFTGTTLGASLSSFDDNFAEKIMI